MNGKENSHDEDRGITQNALQPGRITQSLKPCSFVCSLWKAQGAPISTSQSVRNNLYMPDTPSQSSAILQRAALLQKDLPDSISTAIAANVSLSLATSLIWLATTSLTRKRRNISHFWKTTEVGFGTPSKTYWKREHLRCVSSQYCFLARRSGEPWKKTRKLSYAKQSLWPQAKERFH